jgi:hypothetical protein
MTNASIPSGLWPYFQEVDPRRLDREQDADLIVQRTLDGHAPLLVYDGP